MCWVYLLGGIYLFIFLFFSLGAKHFPDSSDFKSLNCRKLWDISLIRYKAREWYISAVNNFRNQMLSHSSCIIESYVPQVKTGTSPTPLNFQTVGLSSQEMLCVASLWIRDSPVVGTLPTRCSSCVYSIGFLVVNSCIPVLIILFFDLYCGNSTAEVLIRCSGCSSG